MTTSPTPSDGPGHGGERTKVSLLAAALRYAAAGLPVIPMHTPRPDGCTCQDGDGCSSPGKHPRLRHGLHDASVDPRQIRAWWTRWPSANIGIATGGLLDVCDIDTPDALRQVADLLDAKRPTGPVVRTGAGWHVWFAASGLPSRVAILPGIDWRGRGGLVIAPPSRHATDRRYAFTQPWIGRPLPPCPPALRRMALPVRPVETNAGAATVLDLGRYGQAALAGEIARVLAAPRPLAVGGRRIAAGGRNVALNLAAFRLGQIAASGGLDAQTVWPRLTDAAVTAGLSLNEARRTIASGWRGGLRHPRTAVRRFRHLPR